MKSIKYLVVLVCMTLGFTIVAKGQISNNSVMFFIDDSGTGVSVVRCVDNKMYCTTYDPGSVKKNLRNSSDYYDNFTKGNVYLFDKAMSTSKYIVYQGSWTFNLDRTQTRSYVAVSKDLSELIRFMKYDDNQEVYGKVCAIMISKEELLPKALNPNEIDFLNE